MTIKTSTVVMIGSISGGYFSDNGDGTSTHLDYPGPGEPFTTDVETAERLVGQGMAYVPESPIESAAVNTAPRGRR